MEEFWTPGEEQGERPEFILCLFPHLQEILVADMRRDNPRVFVLPTTDAFDEEFFDAVEEGFSRVLRGDAEQPLAHFMTLRERVDDLVRGLALQAVLRRVGWKGEEFPRLAVLVATGPALHLEEEQLKSAFRTLVQKEGDPSLLSRWVELMQRLMKEETQALRETGHQELRQALEGKSERFYTLWQKDD